MNYFSPEQILSQKFQLIEPIGRGGYSEVWKAYSIAENNQVVAIKLLLPQLQLGVEDKARFLQECERMTKLEHPSILKAYSYDVHEDTPYLVMPYYQKGSLETQLNIKTFSEEETAMILSQVAAGLVYLHSKHIIHNDIKPGNILQKDDGSYCLTDFGISTETQQTFLRLSLLLNIGNKGKASKEHVTAFARAYAAPEHFQEHVTISTQSDIFSLGVTMFEIANGDLPFNGKGGASLVRRGTDLELYASRFSNRFEKLLSSCIRIDPENRPSAKELLHVADHYHLHGYWGDIPKFTTKITDILDIPLSSGKKKALSQEKDTAPLVIISLTFSLVLILCLGVGIYMYKGNKPKPSNSDMTFLNDSTSQQNPKNRDTVNESVELDTNSSIDESKSIAPNAPRMLHSKRDSEIGEQAEYASKDVKNGIISDKTVQQNADILRQKIITALAKANQYKTSYFDASGNVLCPDIRKRHFNDYYEVLVKSRKELLGAYSENDSIVNKVQFSSKKALYYFNHFLELHPECKRE